MFSPTMNDLLLTVRQTEKRNYIIHKIYFFVENYRDQVFKCMISKCATSVQDFVDVQRNKKDNNSKGTD